MCRYAKLTVLIILLCSGCGQDATASRIRSETNDRYFPQREIHFVEHGHRSRGVLVSATAGFNSPFRASWATVLVPTPPTALAGQCGRRRSADRDQAVAIAELPVYRRTFEVGLYGNNARFRLDSAGSLDSGLRSIRSRISEGRTEAVLARVRRHGHRGSQFSSVRPWSRSLSVMSSRRNLINPSTALSFFHLTSGTTP